MFIKIQFLNLGSIYFSFNFSKICSFIPQFSNNFGNLVSKISLNFIVWEIIPHWCHFNWCSFEESILDIKFFLKSSSKELFCIILIANSVKFSFSILGLASSSNYMQLSGGESYTADWKVTKVYLQGSSYQTSASVIAGLTSINTQFLQDNWSGSSGVG